MTWTVACFCGNVYTAPPDRCDACASTLSHAVPGDTPTPDTVTASVPSVLAAGGVPTATPGSATHRRSQGPTVAPPWRHAHIDVRSNIVDTSAAAPGAIRQPGRSR
jgi:hypothetical protein